MNLRGVAPAQLALALLFAGEKAEYSLTVSVKR